MERRLSRPSVLVASGSLRCVAGSVGDGHRPGGQRGDHQQPGPRGDQRRLPRLRPGRCRADRVAACQARLGQGPGKLGARGDRVHRQQVVAVAERRGQADVGRCGPAGRPRVEPPGQGEPGTRHRDPAQGEPRPELRRVAQRVVVAEPRPSLRGRVGRVRHGRGERLVAEQPGRPRPRVGRGAVVAVGLLVVRRRAPVDQQAGGERLPALGGEGGGAVAVSRVGEGRDRRVHVVQGQWHGGRSHRRPQQAEVGEEPVRLQRERAGALAPGEVEHRTAAVAVDPPGQPAVVLAQQRVDHARGELRFGAGHRAPVAGALAGIGHRRGP